MTTQNLIAVYKVIKSSNATNTPQNTRYFHGISLETVNSKQLCMHMIDIPSGSRAKVHKHEKHETAIYVISGEAYTFFGDRLEHVEKTIAGDMLFIPANVPHFPVNIGSESAIGIVARTDPNELEAVVLLPELETLADEVLATLKNQVQINSF